MLRQRRSSASSRRLSRPVTTHTSRRAAEGDASSDGSGTDYSDDEVLMLKKDDGFRPVKGQPGMYYKVCTVEPRFSEVPRDWGNLLVKSRVRYIEHLHLTNFLENYQMSVISRYS